MTLENSKNTSKNEWVERGTKVLGRVSLEEVISLYQTLYGSGRYRTSDEHDSLKIDTDTNIYFWNSKGERGNAISWLKRYEPKTPTYSKAVIFLENLSVSVATKPVEEKKLEVVVEPLKFSQALKYHDSLTDEGIRWWNNRGVTEKEINKWLLGFKMNHWGRGKASSIPFIENGNLRTIRHRIWTPGVDDKGNPNPKYLPEQTGLGVSIFNISAAKDAKEVLILEGEIKAMVASRFGQNAIALPGIGICPPRYFSILFNVPLVYVCPDPTLNSKKQISPYELKWLQVLSRNTEVRIVRLPDKIDDMLLGNPKAWKILETAKREAKRA
jgi:hypothetical protein